MTASMFFFKFDKWLKIWHTGFAGFPTNQALRQTEGGTDRDRSGQEKEGADERETDWGKLREGGWERWRGQSKEISRELNEKCTEEKQIFYIWSSDSSEGGRERKDKMKK